MPHKLVDMQITAVAGVDRAANQRKFLIIKAANPPGGKEVIDTANEPQKPSLFKRLAQGLAKMMKMNHGAMTMEQMMGMQAKEQDLYSKEWEYRDAFHSSVRSIMDDESMEMDKKKEMLSQTMEQYHTKLMEHMQAMMDLMESAKGNTGATTDGAVSMSKSEEPVNSPPVNKKEGENNVTLDDITKALGALTLSDADRAALHAAVYKGAQAPVPAEITKRVDDLTKRAETAEANLAAEITKREKAEAYLSAHVAKTQEAEFLAKGAKYPHAGTPEQVAGKLRKAHSVSKEFGEEYEADLAKAEEQINKGGLFAERGKSGKAPEGSAEAQIEKLARDKAAADKIDYYRAYDAVIQENRDLYKRARTEAEKEGN